MSSAAFGDAEPEDSWDPDDPLVELVDNLERRVASLGEPTRRSTDFAERLDDIERAVERLRDRGLDGRAAIRLELIPGDVAHVRDRLDGD